jgi:hypothetical protein
MSNKEEIEYVVIDIMENVKILENDVADNKKTDTIFDIAKIRQSLVKLEKLIMAKG